MVVGGLFLGVIVRWLVLSTPPLPVNATGTALPGLSAPTNSVASPKTAGVSPSARD